jgi:hypothetical protein
MASEYEISPGTVSKILWHFTGGPTWNAKTKKQSTKPKPPSKAYENLKSILRSKELHLGKYREVVKVIIPERRRFNSETKQVEVQKNVPVDIESSSICCLSDIPAPHLRYHAYRYGKFALGFHRNAIIRAGFNPVFYTLQDTPIVRSIYEGFSSLKVADPNSIRDATSRIDSVISDVEDKDIYDNLDIEVSDEIMKIESEVDSLEDTISDALESLENLVAFIKSFEQNEFSTVYCEREWRSTKQYNFEIDDLAMIVLPKAVGDTKYYRNFVEKVAPHLGLPRRVPIVPWDDLVEH